MDSRRIQGLCCIARAALFNVCIADSDLRSLGVQGPGRPAGSGPSSTVHCRAFLLKVCLQDPSWAQRVTDLLDVQFMDTVAQVREMEEAAVEEAVDLWIGCPDGKALPGLLWALCTDDRPEVQGLGVRMCHEAVAVACRQLVEGHCRSVRSEKR